MINVVIGVGYGDEGKGSTTNYLSNSDTTVIRFNGGAQAGHTVVNNGLRHVFSHFGSGTLKGAKTHLSKYFVCEPGGFGVELQRLKSLGCNPEVSVDPNCYITTPYDIFINREIEKKRGNNKHGSVGVGFGETIERNTNPMYRLCMGDLYNEDIVYHTLNIIVDYWFPSRCKELGISIKNNPITSDSIINQFTTDLYVNFLENINTIQDDERIINSTDNIVFEGAQGLMLDPEYGRMPYCTRSNCGLKNISALIGDKPVDLYYVSRPYTTRHGAGPLLFEENIPDFVIDNTNIHNDYQDGLRYAPLNLDIIHEIINKDKQKYGKNIKNIYAVMTCLDQMSDNIKVIYNNKIIYINKDNLKKYYEEAVGGKFMVKVINNE
jgi:adenylosuccinate synthase